MSDFDRDGLSFQYRRGRAGTSLRVPARPRRRLEPALCGCTGPRPEFDCCLWISAATARRIPSETLSRLTIASLADDLVAFLDHLEIDRAVIGGISLGSAVAVNLALRHPSRVLGLVLSRPAWIDGPLPENVRLYSTIARLIRDRGPKEGLERFRKTPEFLAMDRDSPDCARSLIGQFEQPRAEECVARLERLAGRFALCGSSSVPHPPGPRSDPRQSPGPDPSLDARRDARSSSSPAPSCARSRRNR